MLIIKHTSPKRALSHLRKLQRQGEELLALGRLLTIVDEGFWEVRVWTYIDKITANRNAFEPALARDMEDLGEIRLDRLKSPREADCLVRRRIARRLVLLAGIIEKAEALVELESER